MFLPHHRHLLPLNGRASTSLSPSGDINLCSPSASGGSSGVGGSGADTCSGSDVETPEPSHRAVTRTFCSPAFPCIRISSHINSPAEPGSSVNWISVLSEPKLAGVALNRSLCTVTWPGPPATFNVALAPCPGFRLPKSRHCGSIQNDIPFVTISSASNPFSYGYAASISTIVWV